MEKIQELSIDIETYSDVDLKRSGVYRYAESEEFQVLLIGVSVNNGPVKVYDITAGEILPERLVRALIDEETVKWAFNANFERICLSRYLLKIYPGLIDGVLSDETPYLDPRGWKCTMIWSAYMGLPLSLASVGEVLNLKDKKLKGQDLIRYFCCPCKPTQVNGMRTRNLPCHSWERWSSFKEYNARDVEVEMQIKEKLKKFPVPESVWEEYYLDQEINDRGILLDMQLVDHAVRIDEDIRTEIKESLSVITGLENPNSPSQMKTWLSIQGIHTESLDKDTVKTLLKGSPEKVKTVLNLYRRLGKSSLSKYAAMQLAVCKDGRARGMFQCYGANRTGRWAGRLIQLHNLPRNYMEDLCEARKLVKSGEYDMLKVVYDDVPDTLSQLIRTAFVPEPGYKFIICDFSAIEARVLAHIASESWREEVFATGGDIYCASASKMFNVPVVKNGINGHLRQKGKIAELALGYGGSVGALTAMGALDMGIREDELKPLVDSWRQSNPNIVDFWWSVDAAVKEALKLRTPTQTHGIRFQYQSGILMIFLPSGRTLNYIKPGLTENRFGGESVTYYGTGTGNKWIKMESYGPKFVENIIQAVSRDILACSLRNLQEMRIVGHIHDEVIIEAPADISLETVCSIMGKSPDWIPSLNLKADGYETQFYKKD